MTRTRRVLAGLCAVAALSTALAGCGNLTPGQSETALPLCGAPATGAPGINHVIVVVAENMSYGDVVGNTAAGPYVNSTLTERCGTATQMFGATHWSASNYLALAAGQYPPNSPDGCPTVKDCASSFDNVFTQLEAKGGSWRAYMESMPAPCNTKTNAENYKLGHNPVPFFTRIPSATCKQYDLPVADLTERAGAFWTALQAGTLPNLSFVSPNVIHQGHTYGLADLDTFLSSFVPLVQSSTSYQAGDTAMFITFDEGAGGTEGQNCTDKTLGLQAKQESCHIPFWVVYPYTPAGRVSGFFTHYSVTRTIEELFGLPLLAGAKTAGSLIAPFRLVKRTTPTPSPSATPSPTPTPSPSATPTPTPSPSAGPHEYIDYRSFEKAGEAGWSGLYNADSVTTVTADAAHDGARSLKVSSSAPSTKAAGFTSKPAVISNAVAGKSLTSSVWVKASSAGLPVSMMIWETDASGATVGYKTNSMTLGDTAWHQIENAQPYKVKASGNDVQMSVYSPALPRDAAFYADDLSLTSPS